MDREALFQFQIEKIEQSYLLAETCGPNRVVFVADTSDPLAVSFLSHFLDEARIRNFPPAQPNLTPTCVVTLKNDDHLVEITHKYFPPVAEFLSDPMPESGFYVAVISDYCVDLRVHSLPK